MFLFKKKKKIIVVAIVNIDDVLKPCQMSYSVPDINNDLFQLDYRFLYLWISFLISSSGLNRFINCLCFIFFFVFSFFVTPPSFSRLAMLLPLLRLQLQKNKIKMWGSWDEQY